MPYRPTYISVSITVSIQRVTNSILCGCQLHNFALWGLYWWQRLLPWLNSSPLLQCAVQGLAWLTAPVAHWGHSSALTGAGVYALDCEHHVCFTHMHRSQVTCQGRSHVSYLKATLLFRAGRNISLQHWLWQGTSHNVYQIHWCSLALVKVVLDCGFGQWTLFTDSQ